MIRFNVGDSLVLTSPHDPDHPIVVNYRGEMGDGKAMIWTGKTQFPVPLGWLSKEEKKC